MQPGEHTLGYGYGSGILTIVAKKFGTGETVGIDIGLSAVGTSYYSTERNRVQATSALPDDAPEGTPNLVIVNILSNPLRLIATMLYTRIRPGGRLILPSVPEHQAEEVTAAYTSAIPLIIWHARDDWVYPHGMKPV